MNNDSVSVYDDVSPFPTHLPVAVSNSNKSNKVKSRKPKVQIDQKLKKMLAASAQEQGYVILRCTFIYKNSESTVAIDKETILKPVGSKSVCKLIFIDENITFHPLQTKLSAIGNTHRFTLIFEGLPKGTETFHFIEYTRAMLPFHKYNIIRNSTDVYDIIIDYIIK